MAMRKKGSTEEVSTRSWRVIFPLFFVFVSFHSLMLFEIKKPFSGCSRLTNDEKELEVGKGKEKRRRQLFQEKPRARTVST
jgi:hypothetical protein